MNWRDPIVRFGDFEFHRQSGHLRKRGLSVRLAPQASRLLGILLSPPIRAHSREEISEGLWRGRPSRNVGRSLNKVIHSVRQALEDAGPKSRLIENIGGFGYLFPPEWLQADSESESTQEAEPACRIAVLPIRISDAASPELSFARGRITSALTDALSDVPRLRVLAETTVRHCLANSGDSQRIGERLSAHALVCGELLTHLHDTIIRVEVIDVVDEAQLSAAEAEVSFPFKTHTLEHLVEGILGKLKPDLQKLADRKQNASRSRSRTR